MQQQSFLLNTDKALFTAYRPSFHPPFDLHIYGVYLYSASRSPSPQMWKNSDVWDLDSFENVSSISW